MASREFEDFVRDGWKETDKDKGFFVMTAGLAGETGEVCELLKKYVRDGKEIQDDLILELGDVLHYLTRVGQEFNMSLEDIMKANIDKLVKRREVNPTWRG